MIFFLLSMYVVDSGKMVIQTNLALNNYHIIRGVAVDENDETSAVSIKNLEDRQQTHQ